MKTVELAVLLTLALTAGALASQPAMNVTKNLSSMPLALTENQGQWDAKVKFRADAGGAAMWFTTDGAYYQFTRRMHDGDVISDMDLGQMRTSAAREIDRFETMMIKAMFVGANPNPQMHGEDILQYKCNYFIGIDPSQWRTDVANYSAIVYEQIYPGIDLRYYGIGREMEYDFIVSPGADPSIIRVKYDGVESLSVNGDGELVVTTVWGEVIERRPLVYQTHNGQRVSLDGRYELGVDNSFGFTVEASYDRTLPLVIDPVLTYSTYLGGSGNDNGYDIAIDVTGAAYVTGETRSSDFPTFNPYQSFNQGMADVFIAKVSSGGDSLVYSTYLGGSSIDGGWAVTVDASGAAYVTGYTASTDFPTLNAYQDSYKGVGYYNGFVTKLSSGGNSLIYSTYLGWNTSGRDIAVDAYGDAFVTGTTNDPDFPTLNAYQSSHQGLSDAFVTKLSSGGNSLVYSTYLGGSSYESAFGIAVNASGSAYVTGFTSSTNFPTVNAYQSSHQGLSDAFVTKLSSGGETLIYSTYLGGSSDDRAYGGIAVDASDETYVTGCTWSANFPTVNPFQVSNHGECDAFVTKLSASGNSLTYSTYLGGNGSDYGYGIAVEAAQACVTGYTNSTDFPTVNPYQGTYQGGAFDVFVTKLGITGNSLIYGTYLGGSSDDWGHGIAVDASGAAYVTGYTDSEDYPTVNSFTTLDDLYASIVSKLDESCCQLRGDVNHDGSVDPLDAAYFVNYLWLGGPPSPCVEEADVDGSGAVDPLDAIYLVTYFWNGGPAPVPCA